ncbi:hypothetical protein HAZT_HAZT000486 [Hyalella azteca]|uniref:Fork-head domain-containing protein n=1 Tax=Hyalella azteca TaxID=294128 RepID=A0A6A0GTL2_HYAAZ|nr:hypothetical protein HAZT_HAZT000486 [Hyalella azteca]
MKSGLSYLDFVISKSVFPFAQNSIRHNLSLHNRFMRIQNEGTGKSSWWVLNPEAKPGKSTRRRANTLEGGTRYEKKRGRSKKKIDDNIPLEVSPLYRYHSTSSSTFYHGMNSPDINNECARLVSSPYLAHENRPHIPSPYPGFPMVPTEYRPRVSSNASSCSRLSPIPAHEAKYPSRQPWVTGVPSIPTIGLRPNSKPHIKPRQCLVNIIRIFWARNVSLTI